MNLLLFRKAQFQHEYHTLYYVYYVLSGIGYFYINYQNAVISHLL